ncbi:MAG: TIM barrel protein [Alphaproteobacteria bacterium]|nr:TIM barrel protein [Alphaproteobacteria bacterium]
MPEFGLKLWSINTDFYLKEARKLYEKGIYDYIELYIIPDSLHTISKWKSLRIPFIIHAPHSVHNMNLSQKEKEQSNFELYEQTAKFADELDAKYIIFHGGINGDYKECARQLQKMNDERALIENKPYKPIPNKGFSGNCIGAKFDEIKYIKEKANVGYCLDFGHAICAANSLGEDVFELIEKFKTLNPNMYHLTDVYDLTSEIDEHPHLGDGELDIKSIINSLPKDAYVTIETVKNSKENLDDFAKDMEFVKNWK